MVLIHDKKLYKNEKVKSGGKVKIHIGGDNPFLTSLINNLPFDAVKNFVTKNGVNFVLNNAPFPELHLLDGLRRYNFCGPYTKLKQRIEYDEDGNPIKAITPPINKLDEGCMFHDLSYEKYDDITNRNIADKKLYDIAEMVYNNPNSSYKDKANAFIVKNIMDYKVKNKV